MRPTRIALLVAATCLVAALGLRPAGSQETGADYPHGEFQADCATCHGDESWTPVRVDRAFRKSHPFPLKAAHDVKECTDCHRDLDFTRADPECVGCHQDPHQAELGPDCGRCHVARTFVDRSRMLREHQQTRFPLRGSHRALDCEDCHRLAPSGKLQWVNTPAACVDCHRDEYLATTAPNHQAAGYPESCDDCHAPTVWEAGRFNHALVTQPCVTCHLDDYQGTTDPDHETVGFPTTCEQCHRPTRWDDARFDHDSAFFPIYSGRHAGRWDSCATCHVNPGNYAQFSCFGCHPHDDEPGTTSQHTEVSGYSYDSLACYGCHPRGEGD